MLNRAFVAVVLLSIALPVTAEPLKISLALAAAGAAADLWQTAEVFKIGGHEANPMYAWLDQKPIALALVSSAVDVGIYWSLHKALGRKHPRIERLLLYGSAANRFRAALKGRCIVNRAHDQADWQSCRT